MTQAWKRLLAEVNKKESQIQKAFFVNGQAGWRQKMLMETMLLSWKGNPRYQAVQREIELNKKNDEYTNCTG